MDLTVQITPVPEQLLSTPGRTSEATAELIFHASDLPPLGYKTYFVKQGDSVLGDLTLKQDTSSKKYKLNNGVSQIIYLDFYLIYNFFMCRI